MLASEIVEVFTTFIMQERLLPEQGTVIVAVSGGADSLCLLHLLMRLCGPGKRYPALQLQVAHLNHQLRGEASDRDAKFVKQLAQSWQLPVTVESCDVSALARREQRSLEEAAREARYRFLRRIAQGQRIAVAHHQDDQVETLILHWLRGGGIGSMIGLQPRQQDIIRPLLCLTHADALAYCAQLGLTPMEDESNNDTRFLRNRIRHELLPLLEQLNPGMRQTLQRTTEVMEVDYAWINKQVDSIWSTAVLQADERAITVDGLALRALPLSLQRHLLRRVSAQLQQGQSQLELRHFKLLEALMQHEQGGEERTLDLPGQLCVIKKRNLLRFTFKELSWLPEPIQTEVELSIPGRIEVPGTAWEAEASLLERAEEDRIRNALQNEDWPEVWRMLPLERYVVYIDGDTIGTALSIRTRRPGDRMQPLGMQHEKKIQDILVDKRIERRERERIPLFFSGSHCVWLGGIVLDQRFSLTSQTKHIVRLALLPVSSRS